METVIHSIGLKLRQVETVGRWLFGVVADESVPPSPRAPWIDARKAFRRHIRNNNLPTAAPAFFLPLANQTGFFLKLEPESLLRDFLTIDDDDEARVFLRNHGVFSVEDLSQKRIPPSLKKQWEDAQKNNLTPFALPMKKFWDTNREIRTLSDLTDAIQRHDEDRTEKRCRELGGNFTQDYDRRRGPIGDVFSEAKFLLAGVISSRLERAQVAPIEDRGKIIPAIVTTGVRDALYLELMFRITEGTPLRLCKRRKCHNIFAPGPHNNEFCGSHCQNLTKSYRQKYRQAGKPEKEIKKLLEHESTSLMEE